MLLFTNPWVHYSVYLKDINSDNLEIFPKDTQSDPTKTLRSAIELDKLGIKVPSIEQSINLLIKELNENKSLQKIL